MESISFQAKARTVDHLGREQIADCPTAISELWKNSYDAYSKTVELNLYKNGDGPAIAALVDDGHGMSRDEFISRWLVVGTESKASGLSTAKEDRNGLKVRPKLGQKGIGRLSSANLGPLCLIISKRKKCDFVVSLIDWRLFENPFLNLSDILIPVEEVQSLEQILPVAENLRIELLRNVTGHPDNDAELNTDRPELIARRERISTAWKQFDSVSESEGKSKPSSAIIDMLTELPFAPHHLSEWQVWKGESECGTALLVSGLNFDLQAQVDATQSDISARASRTRFFETLSSFVDPYSDNFQSSSLTADPDFSYAVRVWENDSLLPKLILGSGNEFNAAKLSNIEHVIDGIFDAEGVFRGHIRAFGRDLDEECIIYPPDDLSMPVRDDGKVGPFGLYIGALEFDPKNTSLSDAEFEYFKGLAERYAGFLVFRDGLRILPYGRTDNDFFEIDERRSRNAGREFWNHRQMFGRVAISRQRNPNLKDKAGREGFLDNRAAKVLKELVMHVLTTSARRYFGSSSDIRKKVLPDYQAAFAERRAVEQKEKLKKANSRTFRKLFKERAPLLPNLLEEVERYAKTMSVSDEADIEIAQEQIEAFRIGLREFSLPTPTKPIGSIASEYQKYQSNFRLTKDLVDEAESKLNEQIEAIDPKSPLELLQAEVQRNNKSFQAAIRKQKEAVRALLRAQNQYLDELEKKHKPAFEEDATAVIHRFKLDQLTYREASQTIKISRSASEQDATNAFTPFMRALEILKENIDLAHIVEFGDSEASDLRSEVERLHSLAQLGVAVEITGHELHDYTALISSSLSKLNADVRSMKPVQDLELGIEGLVDQLRFLSPMGLSADKVRVNITGNDIYEYAREFFALQMSRYGIKFQATERFLNFSITEFKSRIYPVFINLINNAVYWVSNSDQPRQILLDVINSEVLISDSGPGVHEEDQSGLFTLFFTKKAHGGRGVGLYLCRANLAAGGHKIRYAKPSEDLPLCGANFALTLSGASFD